MQIKYERSSKQRLGYRSGFIVLPFSLMKSPSRLAELDWWSWLCIPRKRIALKFGYDLAGKYFSSSVRGKVAIGLQPEELANA